MYFNIDYMLVYFLYNMTENKIAPTYISSHQIKSSPRVSGLYLAGSVEVPCYLHLLGYKLKIKYYKSFQSECFGMIFNCPVPSFKNVPYMAKELDSNLIKNPDVKIDFFLKILCETLGIEPSQNWPMLETQSLLLRSQKQHSF